MHRLVVLMKKRVGFNARFVPTGKLFDAVIEIDESQFRFGRELLNSKSSERECECIIQQPISFLVKRYQKSFILCRLHNLWLRHFKAWSEKLFRLKIDNLFF